MSRRGIFFGDDDSILLAAIQPHASPGDANYPASEANAVIGAFTHLSEPDLGITNLPHMNEPAILDSQSVCHSPCPVVIQFAEIPAGQRYSGRECECHKPQEKEADQV
jgi:hypothetical protein